MLIQYKVDDPDDLPESVRGKANSLKRKQQNAEANAAAAAAAQRHPGLTRTPSAAYLSASSQSSSLAHSLRSKKSMPDMKTLQSPALAGQGSSGPRLNTRLSNGNMREGYATIASPPRRSPGSFNALFSPDAFVPPVPSLPASVTSPGIESPTIVRQPRGPGEGGFGSRRDRVVASESQAPMRSSGLEARSHEPLEL